MWLMISLLGLISVCWGDGEGVCRESESTLFCVGRWDGIRREGIEKLIIREWDRRWCGEELWEKALIYGRGCTCENVRMKCKETPFSVNGKECQEKYDEEWTTADHQTKQQLIRITTVVTEGSAVTGDYRIITFTTLVSGGTTVTDKPETWAYAWIGSLGGLCVILVIVIVIVCKQKKLFFLCKPRTSPQPIRRDNVVFQLPRSCQDNNSEISLQVYP